MVMVERGGHTRKFVTGVCGGRSVGRVWLGHSLVEVQTHLCVSPTTVWIRQSLLALSFVCQKSCQKVGT